MRAVKPWVQTRLTRGVVKLLIALVGTWVVLFPRIDRAVVSAGRLVDWDALIEPAHPALAGINAEIDAAVPPGATPEQEMQAVQAWVYRHVAYRYDWVTWGNLDHWPTVSEVLEKRCEDCDGRAVLAASLLRARGYSSAHIVGNLSHVWVTLGAGDPKAKAAAPVAVMNPVGRPAFSRAGGAWELSLPEWSGLRPALLDGAKFPVARLLLIALLWLALLFHPARAWLWFGPAAALVVGGLSLWQSWAARTTHAGSGAGDGELLAAAGCVAAGFAVAACASRLESLRFWWHALRGVSSATPRVG